MTSTTPCRHRVVDGVTLGPVGLVWVVLVMAVSPTWTLECGLIRTELCGKVLGVWLDDERPEATPVTICAIRSLPDDGNWVLQVTWNNSFVVVLHVHHDCQTKLLGVGQTGNCACFGTSLCKDWEQDSCENRNDGDDNQ